MENQPAPPNPAHVLGVLQSLTTLFQTNPHLAASETVLPPSIPPLPSTSTALPKYRLQPHSLLQHLSKHILPYLNASSLSPRYYGFVTGGSTPAALAADILASIYDQNVQVHLPNETIATSVEVAALNMLLDLFNLPRDTWGLPERGGGTFTTGATASNVLGLSLGREWVLSKAAERVTGSPMSVGEHGLARVLSVARLSDLRILSTLPHSSIAKAASVIGVGRANVVSIASETDPVAIDLAKLEAEASRDDAAQILAISSGEVNTGRFATASLEQMREVRRICDERGIWVHVDGAFGLFGRILTDTGSNEYDEIAKGCQGLELADSITGDGHKLLNVPYDCGIFFTQHQGLAEEVFRNGNAAYLSSGTGRGDGISSPLNIGIENSRRFRALPVYATLIDHGGDGYVNILRMQIGLARQIAGFLFDHSRFDLLPTGETREVMVAKTFIVVLFRAKSDSVNRELAKRINATGRMYVTGTSWDGRPAVRIAVSNWQVDVERDSKIVCEVLEEAIE